MSDFAVGDRIRFVSVPSWVFEELPEEEQNDFMSFIGEITTISEVDDLGQLWIGFGNTKIVDGISSYSGHTFIVSKDCIEKVS